MRFHYLCLMVILFLLSILTGCGMIAAKYVFRQFEIPGGPLSERMVSSQYMISGEEFEDLLVCSNDGFSVTRMLLKFEGRIDGSGTIYFIEPDGYVIEKKLEGKFKEEMSYEWFAPECLVKFVPEDENAKGILEVKFAAYTYRLKDGKTTEEVEKFLQQGPPKKDKGEGDRKCAKIRSVNVLDLFNTREGKQNVQ
ncbi:MAG: hypothetical protein LBJ31_02475 [Treponema sp.]|nr:hypothetical protein [Treponema sp.]